MGTPNTPGDIKIGVPFTFERGGRKRRFKVIPHPEISGIYAIVGGVAASRSGIYTTDSSYIILAARTLEDVWEAVRDFT